MRHAWVVADLGAICEKGEACLAPAVGTEFRRGDAVVLSEVEACVTLLKEIGTKNLFFNTGLKSKHG